jgi:bifunctional non-homologous end joining protein LigD
MKYTHFIVPMMAKIREKPFDDGDWIFEIKLDGYRAVAELNKGDVKFYSRNGLYFGDDYPEIFEELKKLNRLAVFDGEIVALDKKGRSSFQLLQEIDDNSIQPLYYVFDLLELNGKNIRELPLIKRKELLQKLIEGNEIIRYSDHVEKDGQRFFDLIVKKNLEGMMAKKRNSIYLDGKRSGDWLKIKYQHEQEAIIIGFTEPQGSRKYFGSLVLGVNKNKEIVYAGHVGTGFDEKTLKYLFEKMKPLEIHHPPIKNDVDTRGRVTWIKPVLVGAIRFSEWTRDGQMRQPVFLGLRKDKSASEVIIE